MSSPSKQLSGGLIGCGYISRVHLDAWALVPTAKIAAVCDIGRTKAETRANQYAISSVYTNAERMLEQEDLDFVDIVTRPSSHPALVRLAAHYKRQIICQKPAAESLPEMDEMIAVAQKAGVGLMIHENWRFRAWYRAMKASLERGDIGRPHRLLLQCYRQQTLRHNPFENQPYFRTMPRLLLFEMGPHYLDVARYLMGDATRVFCQIKRVGQVVGEDVCSIQLTFEDGSLGLLDFNWCSYDYPEPAGPWSEAAIRIEGDRGTLVLGERAQPRLCRYDSPEEYLELPEISDPYLDSFRAAEQHFIDCLCSGSTFETDAQDNRKTLELVFAGYRSAETGEVVPIP